MKSVLKTKLSAVFVLALMTASFVGCSEGAYTPSPQNAQLNQTQYGPGGVPTNNNGFPNQQYPQQNPIYQQGVPPTSACQPVLPNCMNMNQQMCAQLTFNAQFQARQNCPSVIRCNATQNATPVAPGCRILRNTSLKKRVVKRCSTCVSQYVITSTYENNRDDDRRLPPVYVSRDDSRNDRPSSNSIPSNVNSDPSQPAPTGPVAPMADNTIPTSPVAPITPITNPNRSGEDHNSVVSDENKEDDSRFIPVDGKDAKAIYERLDRVPFDGTDTDGRVLVKLAPHVKCTVTHPKQVKEDNIKKDAIQYHCWVSVAIKDGSALTYENLSVNGNGKETLKKPKVFEGEELVIGTRGITDLNIGRLIVTGPDAEHMYEGMADVKEVEKQYTDDASNVDSQGLRPLGTLKLATHSKCYKKENVVGGGFKCVYLIDTVKGELLKPEDFGGPSADANNSENGSTIPTQVEPVKEQVQTQEKTQELTKTQEPAKDQAPATQEQQPAAPAIVKPADKDGAPLPDKVGNNGVEPIKQTSADDLNKQDTAGENKGAESSKGQKVKTKDKIKKAFTPKKKKNKNKNGGQDLGDQSPTDLDSSDATPLPNAQ